MFILLYSHGVLINTRTSKFRYISSSVSVNYIRFRCNLPVAFIWSWKVPTIRISPYRFFMMKCSVVFTTKCSSKQQISLTRSRTVLNWVDWLWWKQPLYTLRTITDWWFNFKKLIIFHILNNQDSFWNEHMIIKADLHASPIECNQTEKNRCVMNSFIHNWGTICNTKNCPLLSSQKKLCELLCELLNLIRGR